MTSEKKRVELRCLSEIEDHKTSCGVEDVDVVLDLDHTLVNSYEYGYSASRKTILHPILESIYCDGDGRPELYNAVISTVLLLIKLRPGVRRFVRFLGKRTVVHIYTKGTREYMDAVVSLIDPDGSLIRGSRWAREDDLIDGGIPCDRKFSHRVVSQKPLLILDDSPHIWEIGNSCSCSSAVSGLPQCAHGRCLKTGHSVTVLTAERYEFAERIFARPDFSEVRSPQFSRLFSMLAVANYQARAGAAESGPVLSPFPADSDVFLVSEVWLKMSDALTLSLSSPRRSPVSTPTAAASSPDGSSSPVGRLMQKIASFFI